MPPFCLPPVSFVSPKPIPTLFLSTCNASPAASPPGGSESGRSTPSLSTYSDGKSPSSTYVAAPRHFHIPGMPRLCRFGRDAAFSSTPHETMCEVTRKYQTATQFCCWLSRSQALESLGIHAGKCCLSNQSEQEENHLTRLLLVEHHPCHQPGQVQKVQSERAILVRGPVFSESLVTANSYFCLCHHPSCLSDGAAELRHEMHRLKTTRLHF